jgi:dsRNA-specific ribonuclease
MMIEQGNFMDQTQVDEIRAYELDMRAALIQNLEATESDREFEDTPLPDETFIISETGAMMTLASAVPTLQQYCAYLPRDNYTSPMPEYFVSPTLAPQFESGIGYIAAVKLPVSLPQGPTIFTGRVKKGVRAARKSAAFACAKGLYHLGELTDRLKPVNAAISRDRDVTMIDADKVTASTDGVNEAIRTVKKYAVSVPKSFRNEWKTSIAGNDCLAWISLFQITERLPNCTEEADVNHEGKGRLLQIGLLTPGNVPNEANVPEEFKTVEKHLTFSAIPISEPISLVGRLDAIFHFQRVAYQSLLRSQWDCNGGASYQFLCIPMKNVNELYALIRAGVPVSVETFVDWDMIISTYTNDKMASVPLPEDSASQAVSKEAMTNYKSTDGTTMACSANTFDVVTKQEEMTETQASIEHCVSAFEKKGQELIVSCDPYHNRKVQVIKVLHDDRLFDSTVSYLKYALKVSQPIFPNQPVLVAHTLPRILQAKTESKQVEEVMLLPQFCVPYPIPFGLFSQSLVYLPFIVRLLHHRLLVLDIRSELKLAEHVSTKSLCQAFTAPAASAHSDYERFEFLGDSFLKLILSLHLYAHNPLRQEGWLTEMRTNLERNMSLRDHAIRNNFPGAIMVTSLSRKLWIPPTFTKHRISLSNKTVADTIESVIGACVVDSSFKGGTMAVKLLLSAEVEHDLAAYSAIIKEKSSKSIAPCMASLKISQNVLQNFVDKLHNILGYKFQDPLLALTALTHATGSEVNGNRMCYQRLEFLGKYIIIANTIFVLKKNILHCPTKGDAVLDFVVAHTLFRSGSFSPGILTCLKSELVNNQFLSCVSYKLGLSKLLYHTSSNLLAQINAFGAQLDHLTTTDPKVIYGENLLKPANLLFWHSIPEAPKVLSDILEAIIGAIFIDCTMQADIITGFIERLIIKPWLPLIKIAMGSNLSPMVHPLNEMTNLTNKLSCQQVIFRYDHTFQPFKMSTLSLIIIF